MRWNGVNAMIMKTKAIEMKDEEEEFNDDDIGDEKMMKIMAARKLN